MFERSGAHRLLNLLGVKQLIVGINKMDTDVAKYSEERYVEIRDEMRNMLTKVGWKKDFVAKSVPVLPISGWMGDNLLKKSEKMGWWSGVDIETEKNGKVHVHTLKDALNDMVDVPQRETNKPLRLPISGIYKIKGVGDVLAGRVEQGLAKPGEECVFLPTHTSSPAYALSLVSYIYVAGGTPMAAATSSDPAAAAAPSTSSLLLVQHGGGNGPSPFANLRRQERGGDVGRSPFAAFASNLTPLPVPRDDEAVLYSASCSLRIDASWLGLETRIDPP